MTMQSMQIRVALFAAILSCLATPARAAQSNDADTATVLVPNVISITDTVGNFTLTFADVVSGSLTNRQTVVYDLKANNMPNTALAGVVSAKISALLSGITIKGDPADTSTNNGSAGNIVLNQSGSGDITVGTTAVSLLNKAATIGAQGKVLKGNVGVSWVAVADRDLASTDGGAVTLTVTLKDA